MWELVTLEGYICFKTTTKKPSQIHMYIDPHLAFTVYVSCLAA